MFGLLVPQGQGANKTWSGLGSDANWSTAANWVGTAPTNADNLIFSGTTQPNNTNSISNLTNGWVAFNNGGFTLNGNPITLNNASATFTNSSGTNIINLNVTIPSANSQSWNIAAGSELRLGGALTNGSSSNPLGFLLGGGMLRITSTSFQTTRMLTTFNGTLVIDGGSASISNDGLRFSPTNAAQTAAGVITNSGFIQISGSSSLRLGQLQSSLAAGTASVKISSGTLLLVPTGNLGSPSYGGCITLGENPGVTATVTQSGGLVWLNPMVNVPSDLKCGNLIYGANGAGNGTYNLNAGTLMLRSITNATPGATAVFNFNGGTLMPVASSTIFMPNLITANVQSGGAIIDTTNFDIAIGQPLAGSGALTKLGAGTLTLSGINTYTGGTVISNGTLLISGQLNGNGLVNVAGGVLGGTGIVAGAVTVQPGGTFSPGASVGTIILQSNLMLAGNILLEVDKSLAATNDFVQVSGTLTNVGASTVSITSLGPILAAGDSFKFFSKPMSNGNFVVFSPSTPGVGLAWSNKLAVDGTVGIITEPIPATPADLIGLTLSVGTLSPAFNSNVYSYVASGPYSNSAVVLTPTSANPGTTIRVICNSVTNLVSSGAASGPVALKAGPNMIDVRVTAPDNSITKDYLVTFTRIPPNIVLILADDQGFSDWSCYGSEISTPNLDHLASEGLRFRQFYNCARCSPTRCAVLTGLYTAQVAVDPSQALPNLRNDNNVTIAELLGANGYRAYMSGKWHLGNGALLPESRGFQQVFRYVSGTDHSEDTWDTNSYTFISSNGEVTNRIYAAGTFYQPDAIGDYSLDFISNNLVTHTNDKPFFLYMAFGSAHFPIQAPLNWVNTNVPVYSAGWDAVRNARYTNILVRGVLEARNLLSPNEGTAPWNGISAEVIPAWNTLASDRQADLAQRMAIYAAMIQKMDLNIGRVVERLRAAGQLDNTLIFALSDNGGNYEGSVFGQTGGVPDPMPLTGSSLTNMGLSGQPIIYLGGGWAHVNNTPFRLFKHFNHEGGIRTPMIVHWPQGLTRTNQWENEPGHVIDIMATIVDVTGVSYPTQFNSHVVLPLEGQSLKALFTSTNEISRTLGFEHEGNRAWISGGWKFVTKNFTSVLGTPPANTLELYDLSQDPSETTNVANAQPTLLDQMVTNWNAWALRVGLPTNRFVSPGALFPPVVPATNANDLFVDAFNRFANGTTTNIQASSTGMWGSFVPPMGANAAYYEGYDPQYTEIVNNTLYKGPGGMIECGLMNNFIGSDIVSAGGFSVELTIQEINSDGTDNANRYAGWGVGLSQTEAAAGGDISSTNGILFRGKQGNSNLGVSDFFVELDYNGNVKVWTNGILLDTISVGASYGILTASYAITGFTTNDTVTVSVFFNGVQVDINTADTNSLVRTFKWDRNNSNYLGLSTRASNYVQMDNLAIRKLPLANGLAINYAMQYGLSDTNAAPNADPDGDGVSNFAEWAFGGDPASPDPFIASLKGAALTPSQDFQFTYQRLVSAANYGLRYRYFTSGDLLTWTETTPVQVNAQSNEDKAGYEVVTLELPASAIAGRTNLFLRVLAEPVN